MKCDRCDNEANVTVKAIINGIEHDFHLCNDCMEKLSKGEGNFLFDGNEKDIDINNFDWKSLVDNLFQALTKLSILIMITKFPKIIFLMIIFHH